MSILQNNVFGMHFFRIGIFVRQPDRKRKSLEAKSLEEIPKFLCKCGVVNAFLRLRQMTVVDFEPLLTCMHWPVDSNDDASAVVQLGDLYGRNRPGRPFGAQVGRRIDTNHIFILDAFPIGQDREK